MKIGAIAALIAGLALVVFLVLHFGAAHVFDAVVRVGWGGFAIICLTGVAGTEACLATAWYVLMQRHGVRWPLLLLARQMRDSSSDLLPFTQVGGMVIGARAAVLGGVTPPVAFAGMMVDVTTELIGQIAFVVLGLLLGIADLRASATLAPYADAMILVTALMVPAAAAFIVMQRRGTQIAEKLAARLLPAAVRHTEAFSSALHDFYEKPLRLTLSATCHLIAWIVSGVWIWLIIRLIGVHANVLSVITIEALLGALRSVTVFIPSSVGVQEAGYAALAQVFGMGPEIGLAVSLLKRARDVAVGVPVLLTWQFLEGRRALTRTRTPAKELEPL
ncbi:MAG TPA: lysylphosphatidylglycerol synthase domain-containing protein [Rhizomicrobium sp.]|nr:lysylphosphatidylglycerol synthase domain-containing protein [Rhizomicrobium sp.]